MPAASLNLTNVPHEAARPLSARAGRLRRGSLGHALQIPSTTLSSHIATLGGRGLRDIPEYHVWAEMIRRCTNPKSPVFRHYGGRGIKVCDRWLMNFEAFFADVGPRPPGKSPKGIALFSIERLDRNGHYEPGNCRWAHKSSQTRNTSRNVMVTFDGLTLCVTDWARRVGLTPKQLECRLRNGWPVERALTEPIRPNGRKAA